MAKKSKGVDTPFKGAFKSPPSTSSGELANVPAGELGTYRQTVGHLGPYTTGVSLTSKKTKGKVDTPFDTAFKRKLGPGNTL